MTAPESSPQLGPAPFSALGGLAQERYETVRSYMLLPSGDRPPASAARFLLARVERFGMLGLLDRDPEGKAWGVAMADQFQVEIVPVGIADARVRAARLYEVLANLIVSRQGGRHDDSRALCPGLDRVTRTGTNDREPACRH